jgi:ATP-dependent Lhr-like helicase
MVTLAVGDGFRQEELYEEIKATYAYHTIQKNEWEWLMGYITTGSASLYAYDEFKKVERENGLFIVKDKRVALRHRLSMGTIVTSSSLQVKFQHGKYLGSIEEGFISRLKAGDIFWFAGMNLEFLRIREMTVTVRRAGDKKGVVPQWTGARLPLSPNLSRFIRERLSDALTNPHKEVEIKKLQPLLQLQNERSVIPKVTSCSSKNARPGKDIIFLFSLSKAGLCMKEWRHCLHGASATSHRLHFRLQ